MRIRWRNLELPTKVIGGSADEDRHLREVHGRALRAWLRLTVGNGLRRVLLSSIEGSAVDLAQDQGVKHEFSTHRGHDGGRDRHRPRAKRLDPSTPTIRRS